MKVFTRICFEHTKHVLKTLWRFFAFIVISIALLILLVYTSFVYLPQYQSHWQPWLSQQLGYALRFGQVITYWEQWTPVLQLRQGTLADTQDKQVAVGFADARIHIDLVASVLQGQLITQQLSLSGAYFSLLQDKTGRIGLAGFSTPSQKLSPHQALLHQSGIKNSHNTVDTVDPYANIMDWFWQQPYLQLKKTRFTWQKEGYPVIFYRGADLQVYQQGDKYMISGQLNLPEQRSEPPLMTGTGLQTEGGAIKFSALTQWKNNRLLDSIGQVTLSDIVLHSYQQEVALDNVRGFFNLKRQEDNGWNMEIKHIKVLLGHVNWPLTRFTLRTRPEGTKTHLEGHLNFIRLNELLPLLTGGNILSPELRDALEKINPRAELHHLDFSLAPDYWQIQAKIKHWTNAAWQHIPALHNLSAALTLSNVAGSLRLHSRDASVDFPQFYSQPFALPSLVGAITWLRRLDIWHINFHQFDVHLSQQEKLSMRGHIQLEANKPPVADLQFELNQLAIEDLAQFIPSQAGEAKEWLQDALSQGQLTHLQAQIKGELTPDTLLNQAWGSNGLSASADVDHIKVQFLPDWPALQEGAARVTLSGDSLKINVHQLNTLNIPLQKIEVYLPKLTGSHPQLRFTGRAQASVKQARQYIKQSPLRQTLALKELNLTGDIALQLSMLIPFDSQIENSLKGQMSLLNNQLTTPALDEYAMSLHKITGEIFFDADQVKADKIQAYLFDEPLSVDFQHPVALQSLETRHNTQAEGVAIQVKGAANPVFLNQILTHVQPQLKPVLPYIQGQTHWKLDIHLPEDATVPAELRLRSSLRGLRIDLPAPLAKLQYDSMPLTYHRYLDDAPDSLNHLNLHRRIDLWIADDLSRGSLHFGADPAQWHDEAAWYIQGWLATLSLSEWQTVLSQVKAAVKKSQAVTPVHEQSSKQHNPFNDARLDLIIPHLEVAGKTLKNTHLRGDFNTIKSQFQLDSDNVKGQVDYLHVQHQLNIKFDKIWLNLAKNAEKIISTEDKKTTLLERGKWTLGDIDPRALPRIKMHVKQLKIDAIDLGEWSAKTHSDDKGLHLNNLIWHGADEAVSLMVKADWILDKRSGFSVQNDTQSTHIQARLRSLTLDKTLSDLGLKKPIIAGGIGDIKFTGEWSGAPYQFDKTQLRGHLDFLIKNATLRNVETGVMVYLFRLLDFRAVVQRLLSDLPRQDGAGFPFDTLQGHFFLEGGYAYTDGVHLGSSIVNIDMTGRTGLIDKTYDQDIRVYPNLSGALPLASAVLLGPVTGVAALVVQSLLGEEIPPILDYHYRMTGGWDAPEVNQVDADNSS